MSKKNKLKKHYIHIYLEIFSIKFCVSMSLMSRKFPEEKSQKRKKKKKKKKKK